MNSDTLVLGKEIFRQHTIIGHGTCVVRARLQARDSKLTDNLEDEGFLRGDDTERENAELEQKGRGEQVETGSSKEGFSQNRQIFRKRCPAVVKFCYIPPNRDPRAEVVNEMDEKALGQKNPEKLNRSHRILESQDYPLQAFKELKGD